MWAPPGPLVQKPRKPEPEEASEPQPPVESWSSPRESRQSARARAGGSGSGAQNAGSGSGSGSGRIRGRASAPKTPKAATAAAAAAAAAAEPAPRAGTLPPERSGEELFAAIMQASITIHLTAAEAVGTPPPMERARQPTLSGCVYADPAGDFAEGRVAGGGLSCWATGAGTLGHAGAGICVLSALPDLQAQLGFAGVHAVHAMLPAEEVCGSTQLGHEITGGLLPPSH